ncbi:hypothetical protein, partial [Jeotgalibaca porci]|uniref:hypothetical protein n=1 Tax=Jeotgalibaca porci TaxID=1868793 RepID=UPI0035A06FF3
GTNVGIAMGQTGAEETRGSIEGVGHSLGEVPESKTTTLTSNLVGMIANLITIGLYNEAVKNMQDISVMAEANVLSVSSATPAIDAYNQSSSAMTSTSVTASTTTPGLPSDTGLIDDYNVSSGAMVDTSAVASTSAPGLPGDTVLVDGWNSSSGAMTNSSSTASTSTPGIAGNTSAVWSWIGALNSTYSTSSSLTTYVDTVYRTFGTSTRGFAEGGHIGMFAEGGDIQWGGMFANGGSVPRGFMGIVGEAGPELFHVTKSGVSITPLAPNEKMRGVEGAIEEYMQGIGKGGGGDTVINITFKDPVVREDADFDRLSKATIDRLTRDMKLQKLFGKGRT